VFFNAEIAESAENDKEWGTERSNVFLCGLCDLCVEMAL